MTSAGNPGRRRDPPTAVLLAAILIVAIALRFTLLGGIFLSDDDVRQTYRVIHNPGYLWLVDWATGVLSALIQKLFMAAVGAAGLLTTEFWWRVPSAACGVAQVALTYAFARRVEIARAPALAASAIIAVLPVHVANSRYTWGHEITGLLFLTLALWALFAFYRDPGVRTALGASIASALYLLSHHYILPFFPTALVLGIGASVRGERTVPAALFRSAMDLLRYGVWILPLLAYPLFESSLAVAGARPTSFAFRYDTHSWLFVQDVGILLAATLGVAGLLAVRTRAGELRIGAALLLGSGCYFAPLVFGASQSFTNVKGYMMIGCWLLVLAAAKASEPFFERRPAVATLATAVVVAFTGWGTIANVFAAQLGHVPDPSFTKVEWGRVLRAPSHKAAAYLVREHVSPATVLYLAFPIAEWPARYYFDRTGCRLPEVNFPHREISPDHPCVQYADVVVADRVSRPWVALMGRLRPKVVVTEGGSPRLWIYATSEHAFPEAVADAAVYAARYDARYSPTVYAQPWAAPR